MHVRLAITLIICLFWAGPLAAQDAGAQLYQVKATTFGCADPDAVRTLLDQPDKYPVASPAFKRIFASGRCVTITTQSQWKLVSRSGDLAYMAYAGAVGAPGSFYFLSATMFDAEGRHPGDSPPEAGGSTASATQPFDPSSATALAPQSFVENQSLAGASHGGDGSSFGVVIIVAAILAGLIFLLVIMLKRKTTLASQQSQAQALAFAEVHEKADRLRARYEQLTQPDYYGYQDFNSWLKEKNEFFNKKIPHILAENGLSKSLEHIKPAVMEEIQRCATRPAGGTVP